MRRARAKVDYWQRTVQNFDRSQAASLIALDPQLAELETTRSADLDAQLAVARWRILAYRAAVIRASGESGSSIDAWRRSDPRVLRRCSTRQNPHNVPGP